MRILNRIRNSKSLSAFAWELGGATGKQFVGILISIVLARLLTPADFGLVGMAAAFIVFSEIFIDAGFSNVIIQSDSIDNIKLSTIFFINVFLGLFLNILFFCFSDLIGNYFNNADVSLIVKIYSFSFIFRSLGSVQEALIRKNLQHKSLAQASIIGLAFGGFIAIILVLFGFGYWSLVIQTFLASITRLVWLWRNSSWRPIAKFSLQSLRGQFGFGMSLFFSGLITNVYSQFDTLVIGKYFNTAILGQLYRAKSFSDIIYRFLSRPIGNVFFPYVSQIKHDRNLLANRTLLATRYLILVLCSAGVMLFFLSEPIVLFIFGKQWLPAVEFIKIMAFALHISPISTITASVLAGKGRGREFFVIEITKKTTQAACQLLGLWQYGMQGFLWGLVLGANIGLLVNAWSLHRSILVSKYKLFCNLIGIPVLIWSLALLCRIVGSTLPSYSIIISPVIFGCIIVAIIWFVLNNTNYLSMKINR